MALVLEWDYEGAAERLARVVELKPGYVWGRYVYAMALTSLGRVDDAIVQLERAREFDPTSVSPTDLGLGELYELAGDDEAALATWHRDLELLPSHFTSLLSLGRFHCRNHDEAEGLRYLERAQELFPETPKVLAEIGACFALAGRVEEARAVLGELEAWAQREYVDPVNLALVDVTLGEKAEALAQIERGYEVRSTLMNEIRRDVRYAPLRSQPRFWDVIERAGLADAGRPGGMEEP